MELSYDANGWSDVAPAVQSGVRYARVYNDITYLPVSLDAAPALARAGYSFVGWSASRKIDESSHIYKPDESIELEDSVTFYAQMIDDIAPVLDEASYNSGYKGIGNWLWKYAAIAAIFCVLFYYHSIGKRVNVEWNEVVSS